MNNEPTNQTNMNALREQAYQLANAIGGLDHIKKLIAEGIGNQAEYSKLIEILTK